MLFFCFLLPFFVPSCSSFFFLSFLSSSSITSPALLCFLLFFFFFSLISISLCSFLSSPSSSLFLFLLSLSFFSPFSLPFFFPLLQQQAPYVSNSFFLSSLSLPTFSFFLLPFLLLSLFLFPSTFPLGNHYLFFSVSFFFSLSFVLLLFVILFISLRLTYSYTNVQHSFSILFYITALLDCKLGLNKVESLVASVVRRWHHKVNQFIEIESRESLNPSLKQVKVLDTDKNPYPKTYCWQESMSLINSLRKRLLATFKGRRPLKIHCLQWTINHL